MWLVDWTMDEDGLRLMRFDDEDENEMNQINMDAEYAEPIVASQSSTSTTISTINPSDEIINAHANFKSFLKRVSTIKYWPSINNRLTFDLRLRVKSFVIKIDQPPSSFEKLSLPKRKKNLNKFSYKENVFLLLESENKSQEVLCFGNNEWSQLGLGEVLENEDEPVNDFIHHPFLSSLSIADITYGKDFFVLLTTEGLVYTWGSNRLGHLGLGRDTVKISHPTLVNFSFQKPCIKFIRCAHRHTLALDAEHVVWMWGDFKGLQKFIIPVEVIFPLQCEDSQKFILKVDTGRNFCAALDSKGNVLSWGPSIDQPDTWKRIPKEIVFNENDEDFDEKIIDIACGDRHLMALTDNGNIFYYGGVSKEKVDFKKPIRLFDTRARYIAISAWQGLSVAVAKDNPENENINFCSILGQTRSRPIGGLPHLSSLKQPIQRPFRTPFEEPELATAFYLSTGTRSLVDYDRKMFLRRIYSPFEQRLMNLFNNPDLQSDLKFVFPESEKRVIYAHRFFLRIRSDYLAGFLSETWNANNEVLVKGVDYETFYFYIYYLYTGQLEINWCQAGKLIDFAQCTLEHSLVKRCIQLLLESINNENCLYIYDLMEMHAPEKTHHVLSHIHRHYGDNVAKKAMQPKKPPKSAVNQKNNESSLFGTARKKVKKANQTLFLSSTQAVSSRRTLNSSFELIANASNNFENLRRSVRIANKSQQS